MFIAHMPAGYICTHKLLQTMGYTEKDSYYLRFMILGIIASIFPDADLLYFYFIDNRQHIHHSYWTHIPIFWVGILLLSVVVARILKNKALMSASIIFTANAFLHTVLDTMIGGIMWLYPLNHEYITVFSVSPRYRWWIWNFLIHWTFVFEILIIVGAGRIFLHSRKSRIAATIQAS